MSTSVLLWVGINFLIKCIVAIFFAALGGFGLAAGFEMFKYLKRWRSTNANREYVENMAERFINREAA